MVSVTRRCRRWFGLAFVALVGASSCAGTRTPASTGQAIDPPPSFRLPQDVLPTAERLDLDVDPTRESFHGVAEIDVRIAHARRSIWLHGKGLRVSRAEIGHGGDFTPATWTAHEDGMAEIRSASEIPAGAGTLRIEYDAPFLNDIGVSRVEDEGRRYVFTEFALTNARQAFPCFDEPSFKYVFRVTLTVPRGNEAIANAAEESRTTLDGDRVRVAFRPTKPLPSYLVAFAIGPFDLAVADVAPDRTRSAPLRVRGVAANGRGAELAYALPRAAQAITTLEDYFASPFPFEKLDLIAVPGKTCAMENAGAITIAEHALLLDEATAPRSQRRNLLRVVSHEITHQWLGDLVTVPWWDDAWLSEAFATWMSSKVASSVDASQEVDLLNLRAVDRVMDMDSRAAARIIRQRIDSEDDILNAFDDLSYDKGSAVIGMFEHWVGAETFRHGMRAYVARHAYGSGSIDDLLASQSTTATRDVARPFRSFLDRPGVPFVAVDPRCEGAPRVHLRQARYVPVGSSLDASATWSMPVCVRYGTGGSTREACTLLESAEGELPLEACPEWVFPNADASGYYRFGLAAGGLRALLRHLPELTVRERLSLASNARAALLRGSASAPEILEVMEALARDECPDVAAEALASLAMVGRWLVGTPALATFEQRLGDVLRPIHRELGWAPPPNVPEPPARSERRAAVIEGLARTARDPSVRAEAKSRATAFLRAATGGASKPSLLAPDLLETALIVAGEDADAQTFDALVARLTATRDAPLRDVLVRAIARAHARDLAARARDLALTDALHGIEPVYLLGAQLDSPELRDEAWGWLREHAAALLARSGNAFVHEWTMGLAGRLCDRAREPEIDAFLAALLPKVEGGRRTAANARERAHLCAAQREALLPSLVAAYATPTRTISSPR